MLKRTFVVPVLIIAALALAACDGVVDSNVATANALATRAAGGDPSAPGGENGEEPADPPTETPEPTEAREVFDLQATNTSLLEAWSRISGLPPGTAFRISATERQVFDFIVDQLRAKNLGSLVRGGQVEAGSGQLRIDFALDSGDEFGAATFTFQPTLNGTVVALNPRGADLGGLDVPDNFLTAVGDATYTALSGGANATLSNANITTLSFDGGLIVEGNRK